jgi:hypothetical protein
VASSRVTIWQHAAIAESTYEAAQSWPEYDVTCGANPCSSGKETIRTIVGSGTCATLVSTSSGLHLDCFVDAAPDDVVLYLPDGNYAMSSGVATSNGRLVIRGASRTGTALRRTTVGRTYINSGLCDANSGAMLISVCSPTARGTSATWTANYTTGTTTITLSSVSGFSIGGWINILMAGALACEHIDELLNGGSDPPAFNHYARITNISGNDVTFDRPLLLDYNAAGCVTFIARPWTPVEKFGVENLRLTTDTGIAVGGDSVTNIYYAAAVFNETAEVWMVNVDIDRVYEAWAKIKYTAQGWFQGLYLTNTDSSISFNTEGFSFEEGATDNVFENNWISAPRIGSKIEMAEATVWAYNFVDMDATTGERCAFNHGHYARATLFEGNDCDDELLLADLWWGRNGKYITAYRNRSRRTDCGSSIPGTHNGITMDYQGNDGPAPWAADELNIIGNISWVFTVAPYADSLGCDPPQRNGESLNSDGAGGTGANLTWAERNVYTHGGSEAFDFVDPVGTTSNRSCGTSFGDSCPGTNEGTSGPHSDANLDFPNTLYRTRSEPPSWWCQEACSWDSDGIGAFGDNFSGALCKLPAQIRAESGTCTPL